MPRLIPNIQQPAEREIIFRELESRAAQGDQEAARFLQEHSGMRTITQRQVETGMPSRLPGPVQTLIEPPSPAMQDVLGSSIGEFAGNVAGGMTGPAAPVAVPGLGAAGAAAGLAATRALTGRPQPRLGELGTEAGLSLIPQAIETGARFAGRGIAKASKAAKEVFYNAAKEHIETVAEKAFAAPTKAAAYQAFDNLRALGKQIQGRNVRRNLSVFSEEGQKKIIEQIKLLPAPPGGDIEHFVKVANRIETSLKKGAVRFDLGELQDLRSAMMARAGRISDSATKDLLYDGASRIDTAIRQGLDAIGDPATKNAVQQARRNYFLYTAQEDFGAILRKSARPTRDGRSFTLHLGRLKDAIKNPTSSLEKGLQSKLNDIPGVKERVLTSIDNMIAKTDVIVVEGGLLSNPIGVVQNIPKRISQALWMQSIVNAVGGQLADDIGRERLERIVIENGGKISVNALSILSNAIRRGVTQDDRNDQVQQNRY